VHLGAGDFLDALACLLDGLTEQRLTLDPEALSDVRTWLHMYDRESVFQSAVARVAG
jgi:hypothetical protein